MSQIITVRVRPNSSRNEIKGCDGFYKVSVKSPAEKNKANIEVIKMFSKKFNKKIKIVKGLKSREKVLKIG